MGRKMCLCMICVWVLGCSACLARDQEECTASLSTDWRSHEKKRKVGAPTFQLLCEDPQDAFWRSFDRREWDVGQASRQIGACSVEASERLQVACTSTLRHRSCISSADSS
eukprot:2940573-Amphidinium_carterae.2